MATLIVAPIAFGTATKSSSSSKSSSKKSSAHSHKKHTKKSAKSWKSKGQKSIASDRTREIQEALIREKYLTGEPNGLWDSRTQEACRKYQSANGWQTKVLPDSRALIKLGLGPDHSNVLNPETAATSPYLPGGGEKASSALAPGTSAVRQ
jgi:peptidoglycan hydrolase-like protein with peptidoglycan-binding domain